MKYCCALPLSAGLFQPTEYTSLTRAAWLCWRCQSDGEKGYDMSDKEAGKLQFLGIAAGCDGKSCPTVYRKDEETYVVQGYDAAGLFTEELPSGELAVSVPAELLERIFGAQAN